MGVAVQGADRVPAVTLVSRSLSHYRIPADNFASMAIVYATLYVSWVHFAAFDPCLTFPSLQMLFAAFPIVFQQERGWSPGVGGLSFLGVLVGFILALAYIVFIENPRYTRNVNVSHGESFPSSNIGLTPPLLQANGGWLAPEARLPPAIIGGFLLPIVSPGSSSLVAGSADV